VQNIFFLTVLVAPAFAGEAPSEDAATVADVAEVQVPAPTVYEAEIRRFHDYWPKLIKVPPGTTVIWFNRDVAEHNVHVLTGEKNPLGRDIVGQLAFPGEKFAITFHKEGNYRYFCDPHPYMQANVVVESGARVEPYEQRKAGAEQSQGKDDLTGMPLRRGTGAAPGPNTGAAAAATFVHER
jgi:plastocyanin